MVPDRAAVRARLQRLRRGAALNLYSVQYTVRQWSAARAFQLRGGSRHSASELAAIARHPARVVIVIAGLLGDTVMCTPVIAAARAVWPRATLTLLGQRHNCELLADCPDLDDRIESFLPFSLRRRQELGETQREIASRRFDVALLVLGDQFARMVADAGVPVRVGVKGHVLAACLTHEYEIGSPRTWGPHERLNAIRVLGFDVPTTPPTLHASDVTRLSGRRALEKLGLAAGETYAIVHPFGSTRRQWWPVERVGDVRRHVDTHYGHRTVIVGGPETRAAVPSDVSARAIDATGRLTLRELVGAIAEASLVVSTDSGPYHIAGALGRPLVGLFRARRPEHAGKYPQARVVFGEYADCATQCEWDRCAAGLCRQMDRITAPEVDATIDLALSGQAVPARR